MPVKPKWHFSDWLRSFFTSVVLERRSSDMNPVLEVALENGHLVLNTAHANYSYGRLQQVFRDVLEEVALSQRSVRRALVLGLGAGGVAKLIARVQPKASITGVELDAQIVALAHEYFGLNELPQLETVGADAVAYTLEAGISYDLIVVDVFLDHLVPAGIDSPAFFLALRQRLAPEGLLLFNRIIAEPAAKRQTEAAWPAFVRIFPQARPYRTLGNEVWVVG